MDITTLADELKGIIGMGPAPQPQAEAMGGQASAMAMALMMMGDQADDGDREIAANFKKLAQKYGEFITKATGKKGWTITVGDDLFSIENPKEKTVIDIYWEFDPGNHLADVTVEVTKAGKHKLHVYRRQTMQDIGNQHAPESYLNPLLAFLEHEMGKVAELAMSEDGYVDRPYSTPLMERLVLWSDENPERVDSVEDPGTMGMEEATASGKTSYEVPSPRGAVPAPEKRTSDEDKMVSQTIFQQFGGGRAMQMIGGKAMMIPNGLAVKWPNKQRTKGNYVEIILDRGSDTYNVEFFNAQGASKKSVKKLTGVYADNLRDVFETQTGWYLSMGRMREDAENWSLCDNVRDDVECVLALEAMGFESDDAMEIVAEALQTRAERDSFYDKIKADVAAKKAAEAKKKADTEAGAAKHYKGLKFKRAEIPSHKHKYGPGVAVQAIKKGWKMVFGVKRKVRPEGQRESLGEARRPTTAQDLATSMEELAKFEKKNGSLGWDQKTIDLVANIAWAVKKDDKAKGQKLLDLLVQSNAEVSQGLVNEVSQWLASQIEADKGYELVRKGEEDYWYVKRGGKNIGVVSKGKGGYDADNKPNGGGEFKQGFSSPDEAAAWIAKSTGVSEGVISERQMTDPTMAFGGEEEPVRQGAFKVSSKILTIMRKDYGYKPDEMLFKRVREKLMEIPSEELPPLWGKADMADAQDVIAGRPRHAFQLWLRNIHKLPKVHVYLQKTPENTPLVYYLFISRVSGQDMADIIFKKWFETDQYFKPASTATSDLVARSAEEGIMSVADELKSILEQCPRMVGTNGEEPVGVANGPNGEVTGHGEGDEEGEGEGKKRRERKRHGQGMGEQTADEEPEDDDEDDDEDDEEPDGESDDGEDETGMGEGKCKKHKKPVAEATLNLGAANPNTKRYWELYIKASDAARFMINMNRPNDRKLLASYLAPEEAKELVTLWKKVFDRKPAEGAAATEDLDEAVGPVYLSQGYLTFRTDSKPTRDDIEALRDELVTMTRPPRGRPLGGRESYHVTDVHDVGKGFQVSFEATMPPDDRVLDKIEMDLAGHGFGGLIYDFAKQSAAPEGFDKRVYGAYVDDEEGMKSLDRIESDIGQTIVAQSEWVVDEAVKSPEERGRRYGRALAQTAKRKGDLPAGALAKLGGERGGTSFQRGDKPKLKPGEKMVFGRVVKVEETMFGSLIQEMRDVLDERKGGAYEKGEIPTSMATYSKSERGKSAQAMEKGETYKKPWQQSRKSGKYEKEKAARSLRRSAKKEIQARLRDEHLQMDVAIMLAEELSEAAALTLPGEANLQDTLSVMRDAASGMVKGMTEFTKYLDDALKGKRLDISKLGTYGRQLAGSYRLFQDLFTDLTMAVREEIEGRHYSLDEDGNVFIETIGLDLAEAMAVGISSYDVPSPLGTSETAKAVKAASTGRTTASRVGEFVDLQGIGGEGEAVQKGLKRRLEVVAKEMARKLKNGAMFYISDPDNILRKKEYMQIFQDAMSGYMMTFEPVKSPKTGKNGWRVAPDNRASGGMEVVPGANYRQAEVAFQALKMALKGKKLDTKLGEPREVSPGEFMLMQITKNGTMQFKHSGSRNYVFIKNGKLEVPKTNEPFHLGTFDESMDEATASGKTSYDVPEAPKVAPPRAPSGGMVAAPAWSEYRAQGSSKSAKATVIDTVSGETMDPDDGPAPDMTKVKKFAEKLQAAVDAYYRKEYQDNADKIHIPSNQVSVKPRKKMVAIDVGSSGKYLVGPNDFVWGIKGYGVRHPGYFYGKLDELLKANFTYSGYGIHV